MNISSSKASTLENNSRLIYYGMGAGMSMTLCDLSVNSQISPTVAKIFVSNFRQGFETENANEEFAATNSQALKDGFNTGVKKIEGCDLGY